MSSLGLHNLSLADCSAICIPRCNGVLPYITDCDVSPKECVQSPKRRRDGGDIGALLLKVATTSWPHQANAASEWTVLRATLSAAVVSRVRRRSQSSRSWLPRGFKVEWGGNYSVGKADSLARSSLERSKERKERRGATARRRPRRSRREEGKLGGRQAGWLAF